MTTVLVTGATGKTGRHVVAGLLERDVKVRALVRNPLIAGLPTGVAVVQGSLSDHRALAEAATGVDAAFLLWPGFDPDGCEQITDLIARHARQVVTLSAARLQDDETGAMEGVYSAVERAVEDAANRHGGTSTIVRCGGFAANTLEWANQIRAGDTVRIPFPNAARSLVDERDIADVAVRALLDPALADRTLTVTGPQTLTQAEQLAAIGAATGRDLHIEAQPVDEARRVYTDAMGAEFANSALSYWESLIERPERTTDTVAEITGRPARTFADWARWRADDFTVLSTTDLAHRYTEAFRTGRIADATSLLAVDVVRNAPLEGPEATEILGLPAIAANAAKQNDHVTIDAVDVSAPMIAGDHFAVRFTFRQTDRTTGENVTTIKMSDYTVTAGRITSEDVFYLTPPAPQSDGTTTRKSSSNAEAHLTADGVGVVGDEPRAVRTARGS